MAKNKAQSSNNSNQSVFHRAGDYFFRCTLSGVFSNLILPLMVTAGLFFLSNFWFGHNIFLAAATTLFPAVAAAMPLATLAYIVIPLTFSLLRLSLPFALGLGCHLLGYLSDAVCALRSCCMASPTNTDHHQSAQKDPCLAVGIHDKASGQFTPLSSHELKGILSQALNEPDGQSQSDNLSLNALLLLSEESRFLPARDQAGHNKLVSALPDRPTSPSSHTGATMSSHC